jgi:hypothetical protein
MRCSPIAAGGGEPSANCTGGDAGGGTGQDPWPWEDTSSNGTNGSTGTGPQVDPQSNPQTNVDPDGNVNTQAGEVVEVENKAFSDPGHLIPIWETPQLSGGAQPVQGPDFGSLGSPGSVGASARPEGAFHQGGRPEARGPKGAASGLAEAMRTHRI